MMGTPSSSAFFAFEPGSSPTTTKSVFLDTDDADFPPRSVMASLTPSRVKLTSDPVTTIVFPTNVCGLSLTVTPESETPARAHLATIFRCQSTLNHSLMLSAITSPTPSISASSSAEAFSIFFYRTKRVCQCLCRSRSYVSNRKSHNHSPKRP